jgi:uncharacterized protein (TIGR02118 family)
MTLHVVGALTMAPAVPNAKGRTDLVENPTDIAALVWLPTSLARAEDDAEGFNQAWLVDTRVQWDKAPPQPGRPVPGVKQVSLLRRAAAMDRDQFGAHWSDVHAPLARVHHPSLWRYTQNVVVRPLVDGMADDVDGIAELTMRLRLDFSERMYDSPEGRQIVGADVRRFLDLRSSRMLWSREYAASA